MMIFSAGPNSSATGHFMTSQPHTIYLKDYQPSAFLITDIHLNVDLHEGETRVKSILMIQRNPNVPSSSAPLVLNGEELELKQVNLNGKLLSPDQYTVDQESLIIPHVPDQCRLETEVILRPEKNTKLSGLYQSRGNYCTQCESQGFRRITYFIDRPDIMARFTTTITADKTKYPMLLSNGNLVETKTLPNNRQWVHWEDPSLKPCYLFALVAGDFDLLTANFVTMSGRSIDLRLYVEKGFGGQGAYALECLKEAMRWDEETYGREYDLDIYMIVAVSDFNAGAMENKGLNIFNTKYVLADANTATDEDYIAIKEVIGHEYFHNWSGNRITVRDWFQITLKEGLTVFRDQTFIEDRTSCGVARIGFVDFLRHYQFPEDASPIAHPVRPPAYIEVSNFYTNTVYRKGAEVIRMVRTLVGKEKFRQAMDLYFARNDGHAVTTEDFLQAMEEGSGKELIQFRRWYEQAGTPVLEVTSEYNDKKKTLALTVKQPKKEPMQLPLAIGFLDSQGQAMPTQLHGESAPQSNTRVLEITKPSETFQFIQVAEKPIPSLLRNFSAPVILHYPYTDEELLCLLEQDTDPFVRWEAGQEFEKRLIARLMDQQRQNKPMQMDDRLIRVFKKIINNPQSDFRFAALLLRLPDESYLLQHLDDLNVDVIHATREFVKTTLATALKKDFKTAYERHQLSQYKLDSIDIGKRSLKNSCLSYLVQTGQHEYRQLAYQQFTTSQNMTDIMGALIALINQDCKERDTALQAFYERWKDQPLVINKWFTLQARSTLPNTLARVKDLTQHPAFNIRNPNNVYFLLGAFGENVVRFHAVDGAGYRFLADQVLILDKMNPQIAARILRPLTYWQKIDPPRQQLMKKELTRIVNTPKLSKNVYELATKSLT